MGDDPFIPTGVAGSHAHSSGQGGSAAGGTVYQFSTGLSKSGQLAVVIISSLALGLSLGCVGLLVQGRIDLAEKVEAAERRAMDAVYIAQREARIAQDKADRLEVGLGKRGININTDGH